MISLFTLFEASIEYTKNFKVEKFRKPNKLDRQTEDGKDMYRSKKLPNGEVLTFAIKKTTGPEGGKTKLINIKKPK